MKNLLFSTVLTFLIGASSFAQSMYDLYNTTPKRSTSSNNSSIYGSQSQTNPNVRYQDGYIKNNGTYVQPHYKTESNITNWDNFSTSPNINPYSNQQGTRARDYSIDANNYGSGKQVYTGEKGGQYYINSNGNKTYIPKQKSTYPW